MSGHHPSQVARAHQLETAAGLISAFLSGTSFTLTERVSLLAGLIGLDLAANAPAADDPAWLESVRYQVVAHLRALRAPENQPINLSDMLPRGHARTWSNKQWNP
jgi:hypothetical protein